DTEHRRGSGKDRGAVMKMHIGSFVTGLVFLAVGVAFALEAAGVWEFRISDLRLIGPLALVLIGVSIIVGPVISLESLTGLGSRNLGNVSDGLFGASRLTSPSIHPGRRTLPRNGLSANLTRAVDERKSARMRVEKAFPAGFSHCGQMVL